MKKKCVLLLLLSLLIGACGCGAAARRQESILTCLIAGHDTAAGNTDVLVLASYDFSDGVITMMQIPRDTYLAADTWQNKVNQIYPTLYAQNGGRDGRHAAMQELRRKISSALGVRVDTYLSLTYDDVAAAVDAIGGVSIDLPADFTYTDPNGQSVTLSAGQSRFDGRASVAYLRHRAGYENGDLDRLEVQKRFLAAYFRDARRSMSPAAAVALMRRLSDAPATDLTLSQRIRLCWHFFTRRGEVPLRLMTLAGSAVYDETAGTWYYAVCRAEAERQVSAAFPLCGAFDPLRRLCDNGIPPLRRIYEAPSVSASDDPAKGDRSSGGAVRPDGS